ncbi:DUF2339 domain-containing protein [Lysobacter sp. S4-A87]|uniref:DUF2339 domain-containing protein n=1 Tax=Lysobacter sp. S4-A87 TaxID=2925843 RepID=UPI001F534772|nr:DUF2339 domain-containing protein [Lysobacter sp. S4-A87]UNK50886.1 DUF2339 domain-containing protein [Lysobacter sp. S4-A87]
MAGGIGILVLVVLSVPVLLIVALAMISALKTRVAVLEAQVAQLRSQAVGRERVAPGPVGQEPVAQEPVAQEPTDGPTLQEWMRTQAPAATAPKPPPVERPVAPQPPASPAQQAPPAPMPLPAAARERAAPQYARAPRQPASPDAFDLARRAVRKWFTEGNMPVKVGVLVFFAGIASLLKYASDQGWMRMPVELRLAGIAASALAALVFGWRQREARRSFALSLQGGAIGVLLLVIFAAFRFYQMIPAGVAFALSVVLVAGAGVLAVRQNAIALAVLGILAGFLAPIWLSTGSGNHVALFGYYAVLNLAIFVIAWVRPWRALNLLGFVFTFGVGTVWGVLSYKPEHFATTEPFLLLFFFCYLLVPILYAQQRPDGKRDRIDGCLVFGTPLVAFALQAALLEGDRMQLALCALALAAVYAALAWWLRRRERFTMLATSHALLAVGFATLAVPLALSAQATACVFALEGAALVWLGSHQQRQLPQVTGLLLQLLAAGAFAIGLADNPTAATPIANAACMGALLIAIAGFASAWSYRRISADPPALVYYLWGLGWWCGNALHEIDRFVTAQEWPDAVLMFAAVTGWVVAEVYRRIPARALAWSVVAAMAAALPLALVQDAAHDHPFAGLGGVAWLVFALAGWRSLRCLRDHGEGESPIALAHSLWLWSWALAAGLSLYWLASQAAFGDGWKVAALGLPAWCIAALVQWRPQWIATPLASHFEQWRAPLQRLFVLAVALGATVALTVAGSSTPLQWLPVLNPLDLAQLAVIGLAAAWLASPLVSDDLRERRIPLLAAAGFALITVITLRTVHHVGGIAWGGSMFSTSLVQTSLTIVWSVLGVFGWILGSRRGQRDLWRAGAVLMAVVLVKLVLVDRSHLGTMLGIASFIAYGLLCTLVGYFAPAPPRALRTEFDASP